MPHTDAGYVQVRDAKKRAPRDDLRMSESMSRTVRRIADAAHAAELDQLASGFSHELNQSLGAIAAFAQAGGRMLSGPGSTVEQAAALFRDITRVALAAGADVRRMRNCYALASPDLALCGMPDLIGEIEPLLALIALQSGGCLDIEEPSSLPDVRVERPQIQYVLICLTRLVFEPGDTAREPPLARIRLDVVGGDVETSVIDSRPGPKAARDAEPFLPFSTAPDRGGGLSLAATRSIIEAHGGTLGWERLEDRATRYWFRLPAAVPPQEPPNPG